MVPILDKHVREMSGRVHCASGHDESRAKHQYQILQAHRLTALVCRSAQLTFTGHESWATVSGLSGIVCGLAIAMEIID